MPATLAMATVLLASQVQASGDPVRRLWHPTVPLVVSATRGEIRWRLNPELLAQLGLRLQTPDGRTIDDGKLATTLTAQNIDAAVAGASLDGWRSGTFAASSGFVLVDRDGRIRLDLSTLSVRPRAGSTALDLLDGQGRVLLYADAVMAALSRDRASLDIVAMDVRIADDDLPPLAHAGLLIGDAQAHIALASPAPAADSTCAVPHWPGSDGGAYVADITLDAIEAQAMRCGPPDCTGAACVCDGPGGSDAAVVIAAEAHLSNPDDDNGGLPCTATDPCSADVPWNPKFSPPQPPYGNDQHPFLIWNLYRLDPDGRIAQIGRSGVKHAFIALNTGCGCEDSQTLGRGCSDVYAAANNDSIYVLGPRSEIDPATVRWGRCGAIDDNEVSPPNPDLGGCDGVRDSVPDTPWGYRLAVRESQLDPALHPGSRYLFEAWYLVRDDADIDNAMGYIEIAPHWTGIWNVPAAPDATFHRGPAIDAWAMRGEDGPMQHTTVIDDARGRARLSVRVRDLGYGRWRYDYALMNFSFAQTVTAGTEPNLRVVANPGVAGLVVPLAANGQARDITFDDGDLDAGNDWTNAREPLALSWHAQGARTLDWGTLFRFSFTADAPPVATDVSAPLRDTPDSPVLAFASLAPGTPDSNRVFADGFEPSPDANRDSKTH